MALKAVTCTATSKGQWGVADVQGNSQHSLMGSGGSLTMAWADGGASSPSCLSYCKLISTQDYTSVSVCYLLTVEKSPVSNYMCLSQFSVLLSHILYYFDCSTH